MTKHSENTEPSNSTKPVLSSRLFKFRAWNSKSMLKSDSYFDLEGFFNAIYHEDIILQFTGLFDINGKEIYEGDIILCDRIYWDEKKKLIVEYDVQSAAFYLLNKKDSIDSETFEKTSCFCVGKYEREVIGNIFENPELL